MPVREWMGSPGRLQSNLHAPLLARLGLLDFICGIARRANPACWKSNVLSGCAPHSPAALSGVSSSRPDCAHAAGHL